MKAYSVLSKVYEYLILDDDYKLWADFLVDTAKKLNLGYGSLNVDCACGSGYFTRALKRAGYNVTGVDFSQEMLVEAKNLTAKEGLNIDYLQMDMSNLKSFKKVDFITVINDGINYVEPKKILKTFKSFYSNLNRGGYVLFDISSEYKIKNIIGNNLFGEDTEKCSYLWFNRLGDGFVDMDIVLFTPCGDKYVRTEESHRQYAHSLKFICDSLISAGFSDIQTFGLFGRELTFDSDRICFIAKKV